MSVLIWRMAQGSFKRHSQAILLRVMLKVELESEILLMLVEGLLCKDPENRGLVNGKTRSTLFKLELRVREYVELGIGRYDMWLSAMGPKVVWVRVLEDLSQDCGCSMR
jgi:hypothetical protein